METEELLKGQETGRFLIRLSQRTFGYVLSYKGKERCRHFIINQLLNGELVVSGDSKSHDSLSALINHYQTSPIYPYGEKLTKSYIKFSDFNKYDEIEPGSQHKKGQNKKGQINSNQDDALSSVSQSRSRTRSNQEKITMACIEDTAPPLPERNISLADNLQQDVGDQEVIRRLSNAGFCMSSGTADATVQQHKEASENIYSQISKGAAFRSLVKETHVNQKKMGKTGVPEVIYSEVKLSKHVPTALGHLQSFSHSTSTSQETVKMTLDTKSLNGEYEVVELNFASSIQCSDRIQMLNREIMGGPMLPERVESIYSYCTGYKPDLENTYEQLPLTGLKTQNRRHDEISSFSENCKTSSCDQGSSRTLKDTVTENPYEKARIPTSSQGNVYEVVERGVSKLAVKKQTAAQKNEKQKRFFFADKKK
ncbi:hypothetical protein XENTR_v10008987 [Xenopus tropicalis]|uniref:SH2 domain-containing protein n=1 Tax=Xenopus tropicalis TaxID=8364 RepID=A0A803J720_XENTR|nr:hypothetical protein XENTR_v10008987 [Xenopus tropicalis]